MCQKNPQSTWGSNLFIRSKALVGASVFSFLFAQRGKHISEKISEVNVHRDLEVGRGGIS